MRNTPSNLSRPAQRVLVIGWDAADWRILRPLMDQGLMPAMSKLVGAGMHGNLATLQPALSPLLWTSIATGKRADKHGIHGFLEPIPDGTGVRPVSSTSRKIKAVWNIAHQNDLRSLVVGWYASHPAEPVRGVVVSDRFVHGGNTIPVHGVSPEAQHEKLTQALVRVDEITPDDLAAFIPRIGEALPEDAKPIQSLAQVLARAASVQSCATRLMLDEPWDLAMVFFDGLDHLGHTFMPYHPPHRPGVCEREYQLFKDVITGGYRFFDMMLEAMLAHAGPDTTVVLVSDHGFKSDGLRPRGSGWDNPVDWHRPLGIAVASGPGVKHDEQLFGASVLDVTPTVLRLLGIPGGMDMDGRPWLEMLEDGERLPNILSWETESGEAGLHGSEMREDSADAIAMVRQLVDLGYVAPLSEDIAQTIRQTQRDNHINLALSLIGSPRAEAARPVVDQLLEDYPEDVLTASIGSRFALVQGDADRARQLAERASELGGRTLTTISLLAEAAILDKDDRVAIALYTEAIALEKSGSPSAATFCRLGDAWSRLDDLDASEAAYRDGLLIDADYAQLWVGLSKIALRRGDATKAVEHAIHAVSLMHVYPEGHLRLAEALAAAGRQEDAVVAAGVCLRMAPRMRPCIELLARLKEQLDHDDASFFAIRARGLAAHSPGTHPVQPGVCKTTEKLHVGKS